MCKEEKDSREINSAILQILQQHLLYQDHFVLHNQQYMPCRPRALSESKCKQNYNQQGVCSFFACNRYSNAEQGPSPYRLSI